MMLKRNTGWKIPAILVLLSLVLTGCRAFQPEAVVVNKAPETYIIGAPAEDGGGYFHFHVYWYGSDEDGKVERFVWAVTDTTVQDDRTSDDEEDINFNPALDATTLEIGHYTTRTDSVFNFTIDQGVSTAYDLTLHMVAIDDYGDFDRTPARLHFFTNTLGNPTLRFFRIDEDGSTTEMAFGEADTVGYGVSYRLGWAGTSPNIQGFDPAALAELDTVPPVDDGLFGYKWRILGELGGNCIESETDCWHPRKAVEATGDSISYFGSTTSLFFANNGNTTDANPFLKLLPSGEVKLEVNSIDVAGVEVATSLRPYEFVVNYDPETRIVEGFDSEHPEDPEEYPYYIQLNDTAQVHHPFRDGDRIPDRTYVVVKALGRDDQRDVRVNPEYALGMTGYLEGVIDLFSGGAFSFKTQNSTINYEPAWPANGADGWYADTLGFLVGPRDTMTVNMQSIDEHGRPDGSPARLKFTVGYPPCIQCIELLPKRFSTSRYDEDTACYDGESSNACFDGEQVFRVTANGTGLDELEYLNKAVILIDKNTGFTQVLTDTTNQSGNQWAIPARLYRMEVLLHGIDDPRESWTKPLNRIMAWRYQVDYDCDPYNQIKDGGGNDGLNDPTYGTLSTLDTGLEIDAATGIWKISVDIGVPEFLITLGESNYRFTLLSMTGNDEDLANDLFDKSIRQTGGGSVKAVALDQVKPDFKPERPSRYNIFAKVRPAVSELPAGVTWRDKNLATRFTSGVVFKALDLSRSAMASLDDQPAEKRFRIIVNAGGVDFECSGP